MYEVVYMGVMGGLPVSLFGKSKAWPRLIHARVLEKRVFEVIFITIKIAAQVI